MRGPLPWHFSFAAAFARIALVPQLPQKNGSRRVVTYGLSLAFLAAVLFAAVQVHALLQNRSQLRPDFTDTTISAAAGRPWAFSQPAALGDDALREARLSPFTGDPAGIAPPPGAVGQQGFAQNVARGAAQHRLYEYPGTQAAAADYYRRLLADRGFATLADNASPDGRLLTFIKDRVHVTVALRNAGDKVKIVRIEVTVISAT